MKPKLIESPEVLHELFKAYYKETKEQPRLKHTFVGKDGKSEFERLERPLTMEGFRVYAFENASCIKHYFDNTDGRYNEYGTICSHIKDIIRRDQIEGGMAGQYNPSITQRLNNLTERTDVTTQGQQVNDIKITIVGTDEQS